MSGEERKSKPLPLAQLLGQSRHAATVFVTIATLANGKRQLGTTRNRIAELCGLSPRLVGEAVDALDRGGWIKRRYGRSGRSSWYRITLPKIDLGPVCRKPSHRESAGVSKIDTQGIARCVSKIDIHIPSVCRGARKNAAPPPTIEEPKLPIPDVPIPDDAPDWVKGIDEMDAHGGGPAAPAPPESDDDRQREDSKIATSRSSIPRTPQRTEQQP